MELLRDRSAEFEEAGVRAFGISRDSPWTHIAWMQALDLEFPAALGLERRGRATASASAHEFRGMRGRAERTAFLIDRSGTVRGAWRYDDSEVPDFDELLSAAQAL